MKYISSIRINRHVHYSLIAFALIFILFFSIGITAAAEESTPEILILDAYHQGEDWSDNEIDGIRIAFHEVYPFLTPSIEHMDTKRFPNPDHLLFIKNYLKSKYLGKHFDIIMTLDNSALNLMLQYGNELFPKVPIVFAGVNGYRPDMLEGHTNITGVAETQDMEGTLRLAIKINPQIKTVFAIHDYTTSGFAVRMDMESIAEKYRKRVKVEYTPEGTIDDLVAQLKALPQNTGVLLLTYVTDKNGRTLTREESTRLITTASPVPVYAMHETRLGYGIVGGMLLEGREHGMQAAVQALRILAGEKISQISVENSRSRPVFDHNVLNRFNISEKLLPTDSVIINRPASFWRQYRTIWVPGVIIIAVLVISTVLLSKTVIRMHIAEKSLRDAIQMNKEIIDSAQEGVIVYDLDLRYRVWNPFMEKLSGVSAKNVLGLQPLEVFPFHKETQLMKILERALDGETPEPIDFQFLLPDSGLSGWTSDQSSPLRNANGDIIGVIATVRDITNRKEVEENLRRNERLLQNIIDSSADYIYVKDSYLRTVLCNKTFAQAVGKNPQDMVGKTDIENGWLPEFVIGNPEKGIKGFEKDDKDALCGKTVHTIDEPGNVKGKVRSFDTIKMPLRDENGSIIGMFGISRDITERQQAEKELLKQKYFLQKAQEIGNIGTWELNVPENELLWTDENYRIFGLPIGTALTYETFLNCVHPDDREYVDTEWKASFAGKPYDIEHRLLINGKVKWVREKAELTFDEKSECVRGIGFTQEITERKQAEEALKESETKYRQMMESMSDPAYICSKDFRVEYMNAAMIKRIGRDATGEICHKVMHGLDEKCPWCIHEKVMQGKSIKTEVVSPVDNRIFHVSNSPISHSPGSLSKLTVFRDITETRKIEERLQQAQKMESIGNLAGGIAHDFNNLLYPIIGMSELLLEDLPPGSPEYENAQEIFEAGMRGGDLVKQILAFSRQSEHKKMPVRIQQVLEEVLKLCRATIPSNIEITQTIQKDCGKAMADATQLHQIAMNLITNAYHAVETNNGKISVVLKEVTSEMAHFSDKMFKPGKYALLSISDTGMGIPNEVMNKIFEPYFTTKEKGKGTGLGLAVVYGIVKEYNGDIKVYSEPGKGTTFDVYLPLIGDSIQTTVIDKTATIETGTERILLVDDEMAIAKLEKLMLERLGYHVISRLNGIEALEIFTTQKDDFDLVITDMSMPHMTGDQLAKELISIRPDIPVIICTGFSEKMDEEKAKEIGVKGLLMKPVVKAELTKMIRKVLDENKS